MNRTAKVTRETKETKITMSLNLDGTGKAKIDCPVGFFVHMLETFCRHGLFDLEAKIEGDFHVDEHHAVEDSGIVLGQAFLEALGDKIGIERVGSFSFPMDEALGVAAVDFSGRPFLRFDAKLGKEMIGDYHASLTEDFFQGFVNSARCTLHISVPYGRSAHHEVEAIFKASARALKAAVSLDPRSSGILPSTKGAL